MKRIDVGRTLGIVIKLMLVVALIAIGLVVYQTCAGSPLIQRIDKTLPDVAAAPLEVATQTHIYYAEKATLNDDGSVTMVNWYEKLNNRWKQHMGMITLPPTLRPRASRR
jgi:hypothetical protein